jgi:predicted AAA+ superfamily ATPase
VSKALRWSRAVALVGSRQCGKTTLARVFAFDSPDFFDLEDNAELDLLLFKDGRRVGIECKLNDAPEFTKSMHTAMQTLKLDELKVIYTGSKSYELDENVQAIPLSHLI